MAQKFDSLEPQPLFFNFFTHDTLDPSLILICIYLTIILVEKRKIFNKNLLNIARFCKLYEIHFSLAASFDTKQFSTFI